MATERADSRISRISRSHTALALARKKISPSVRTAGTQPTGYVEYPAS